LPGSVITFDPERLKGRIAELEQELGAPGFWDDQQRAARVSSEHARLTKRLERYERLSRDYEDARELFAMDGDMAAEIADSIEPLRRELERLQEDALFTGEYDGGDAVVTIHAGTGGTDARTGPRSCCACICAGPQIAASRPIWSRRARGRRPG